jgi:hypothetical protein
MTQRICLGDLRRQHEQAHHDRDPRRKRRCRPPRRRGRGQAARDGDARQRRHPSHRGQGLPQRRLRRGLRVRPGQPLHVRRRRDHAASAALQVLRARRALLPVRGGRGHRPQLEIGPVVEAGPLLTRRREGRRPEAPARAQCGRQSALQGLGCGLQRVPALGQAARPGLQGQAVGEADQREGSLLPERADRDDAVFVSLHLRPGRCPASITGTSRS